MKFPQRSTCGPSQWVFFVVAFIGACSKSEEQKAKSELAKKTSGPPDASQLQKKALALFGVLPSSFRSDANPSSQEKIALGRELYFDKRLSKDETLSCNSCHDLAEYGIEVRDRQGHTSKGVGGQPGDRNSPTVYNAALQVSQFWDGRAPTVEEQAKGPVLNPVEMAMPNAEAVIERLKGVPAYMEKFQKAFPGEAEPVTFDNMAKAIGVFERELSTPGRFDAFLNGDLKALTSEELAGLQTFIDTGCPTCHNGPGVGGGIMQKLGLFKPYKTEDTGRYRVTKNESDKFIFKVPMLRNVTRTAPYFHDGSIAKLDDVIRIMSEHQTATGKLEDKKVQSIKVFLGALEGKLPEIAAN